jgi:hypothetical protein
LFSKAYLHMLFTLARFWLVVFLFGTSSTFQVDFSLVLGLVLDIQFNKGFA